MGLGSTEIALLLLLISLPVAGCLSVVHTPTYTRTQKTVWIFLIVAFPFAGLVAHLAERFFLHQKV